ncbi:MAG: arsenic resistance N-acetyltransferase ArsN2 [Bacteroidota bacterium]
MSKFREILRSNGLPTDDLSQPHLWFFSYQNGVRVGTLGLEQYGSLGFLRSLSILPEFHAQGLGSQVVKKLIAEREAFGCAELYLMTTDAAGFFSKFGFQRVERSAVPESIKQTQQYSSICPSSAIVMKL